MDKDKMDFPLDSLKPSLERMVDEIEAWLREIVK